MVCIAFARKIVVFALLMLFVFIIGCNNDSKEKELDSGYSVQSVINYVNDYSPNSLSKDAIKVCTPNQVLQVYYHSLILGDDITYQNIHSHPVETLDVSYLLGNLVTYLIEEDAEDRFKVFLVSFDLHDNRGTLFPRDLPKVTMRCKLVRDQDCWQIDCIELVN
ncbi:MAG TPA: hypothetical protein DDY38_02035 [Firmicutes bacterium]|jgi:hypothetical protein|nr:hypothetical protein [Bacillota bacterium]